MGCGGERQEALSHVARATVSMANQGCSGLCVSAVLALGPPGF